MPLSYCSAGRDTYRSWVSRATWGPPPVPPWTEPQLCWCMKTKNTEPLSLTLSLSHTHNPLSLSSFSLAIQVPFRSVRNLMTNQENSDIQLTWREIPLADRRGYLLGYRVYLNTGPQLTLIGKTLRCCWCCCSLSTACTRAETWSMSLLLGQQNHTIWLIWSSSDGFRSLERLD